MTGRYNKRLAACLLSMFYALCGGEEEASANWAEGFEGMFPPEGWAMNSVDQSATYSLTGTHSARLNASSDYLISPPIGTARTLIFWSYTTASDPLIIVERAAGEAGPWTETAESPFSGDTEQWNRQQIAASTPSGTWVRFRKSGYGTLYLDDISIETASIVSNQPPILDAMNNQTTFEGQMMQFTITASDPIDNDLITLSASGLPTGAVFTNGIFKWTPAAPAGAYAVTFFATDKDGTTGTTVNIRIEELPALLISEIADPLCTGADAFRFVELYNAGSSPINLEKDNWYLCKQVNGGSSWSDIPLSGTIPADSVRVIASSESGFTEAYGNPPDQVSSAVGGNGDDAYGLFIRGNHTEGILIDLYGQLDTDGTDSAWDYENSRATRNNATLQPSSQWTASEWIITQGAAVEEMTPGAHGPAPEFENLNNLFVFLGDDLNLTVLATNTVRPDTITLSASALPSGAVFLPVTGSNGASSTLAWESPSEGIFTATFAAAGKYGTCTRSITITVSGTSKIDGNFYGWNTGTILKLKNGQFWKNSGGSSPTLDPPLYCPKASVTLLFGRRRMAIEGISGHQTVEQIALSESALVSAFQGLHNKNRYVLDDGSAWEQTSFENIQGAADPEKVWRTFLDNKTVLRFIDRTGVVIGSCQVKEASPALIHQTESAIDGWFRGWHHRRVFALANGQFWQQTDLDSTTETRYRPAVTLSDRLQTGRWEMTIEGCRSVAAQQLTNVTRTAICGLFQGLGKQHLFHLADGSWWRQTSSDTSSSARFNPEILIWNDNGTDMLALPDEGRSASAERLLPLKESTLTKLFSGLHFGNLYQLAEHEGNWLQVSFEQTDSPLDTPSALLWLDGEQTRLTAYNERDGILGTCTVMPPDEDTDGDQISNEEEVIAGSDPLCRQSTFQISRPDFDETGRTVLRWDSVKERVYSIEWTPALSEKFQRIETHLIWPQNSWTDAVHSAGTKGFYRIDVQLEY